MISHKLKLKLSKLSAFLFARLLLRKKLSIVGCVELAVEVLIITACG